MQVWNGHVETKCPPPPPWTPATGRSTPNDITIEEMQGLCGGDSSSVAHRAGTSRHAPQEGPRIREPEVQMLRLQEEE
eukprot:7301257-Karenia_brevis.AAC.1